ncbi:MAG: hypothetical protein ACREGB_02130 [Candidatus Saccharimonadales bacterium]
MTALIGEQPSVVNILESTNLQATEGFLLPQEPAEIDWDAFDNSVEAYIGVQSLKAIGGKHVFREGVAYNYRAVLEDNTRKFVRLTLPHEDMAKTDVPVVHKGAWFTDGDGHNFHTDLRLAKAGIPSLFVGASGESAPGAALADIGHAVRHPGKTIHEIRSIDLGRTAAGMHAIADAFPLLAPWHGLQTKRVGIIGESHGTMAGMGFVAQAPEHGREVVAARFIAGCFPEKISSTEAGIIIAKQLPAEARVILHVAKTMSASHRRHNRRTLSLNPLTTVHTIATWGTLHSGRAGEFGRKIPHDQIMDIVAFEGDRAGSAHIWHTIFANHPFVQLDVRPGAHMSIVEEYMMNENIESIETQLGITPAKQSAEA